MSPFQTGTPLYFASFSTVSCEKPRNSIPSNILPSTRAVSSTLSLYPSCISSLPRYSGCPPSSMQPMVKEQRVLVDGFSKISAIFLPFKLFPVMPCFFFAFSSAARSTMYIISSGVKSFNVKNERPFKFISFLHTYCGIAHPLLLQPQGFSAVFLSV